MVLTGLVFLFLYAVPIIWPNRDAPWIAPAQWVIWFIFVVDLIVRIRLSADSRKFLRANWFDVIVVLVPMLRLLRLVVVLMAASRRASARTAASTSVGVNAVIGATFLWFLGGLAITNAERGAPDANITGVGDGWWWAITTITTVGYGDRYPVTGQGRVVAAGLMLAGIALLGVVTASVAAWFVAQFDEVKDGIDEAKPAEVAGPDADAVELGRLAAQLDRIEASIRTSRGDTHG